ncbi:HAMP domain-containing sensor histidine kinase [Lebetimonas sp. JH369]|uniref:HAMP domain-containing sensor histidine kinase n=2 Tax=unclassified Lebetimonas TaxID=2648158 RepID=UPI0004644C70|nr:HAMP domain-containing sensor histidine kinase [Lebetimonas sp. JH369]
MKFNSLKIKILLWFGAVLIIIIFIFSFLAVYFFNKSIKESIKNRLYKEAVYIENHLKNFSYNEKLTNLEVLIYQNNKIIFKSKNFDKNIDFNKTFQVIDEGEKLRAVFVYKNGEDKIILIKKNIIDKVENLEDTLLVLDPLLIIILLFFANKMINKILEPVEKTTELAKKITIQNLNETLPIPKNYTELQNLALAFNEMIKRLNEGAKKIERFNSDVSHELKTPLTIIKGEIDLALRKERNIDYYKNALKKINNEISNLQKIINSLLLLIKNLSNQNNKLIELDDVLLQVLERFEGKLKEKNLKLHIENFEKVLFTGDKNLIYVVFSNLIENAIKYTPENKNIYVSLYQDSNIHFIVEDEGIGIKKEEISKITDEFYRIEKSRNKKTEGFGLGLSIVKKIVEFYNGKIIISSEVNKDTKVEVVF